MLQPPVFLRSFGLLGAVHRRPNDIGALPFALFLELICPMLQKLCVQDGDHPFPEIADLTVQQLLRTLCSAPIDRDAIRAFAAIKM